MGAFKDWLVGNNIKYSPTNPADVGDYWDSYKGAKHTLFQVYTRARVNQPYDQVDIDTAATVLAAVNAAAGANGPAMVPHIRAITQTLDAFSDRVVQLAAVQVEAERVQVLVQAQANAPVHDEPVVQGNAPTCTVRLQLQTNFKMKKGKDTLATEVLNNPRGVSVASLDEAFENLVLHSTLNGKLQEHMRAAYAAHKNLWATYAVGKSHSINFDKDGIMAAARPSSGYRLDVENIRCTAGLSNFI